MSSLSPTLANYYSLERNAQSRAHLLCAAHPDSQSSGRRSSRLQPPLRLMECIFQSTQALAELGFTRVQRRREEDPINGKVGPDLRIRRNLLENLHRLCDFLSVRVEE